MTPYGYLEDTILPSDYTLGTIGGEVVNPSGQWLFYMPENEAQKRNGLETQNCTMYGTLNALETLLKYTDKHIGNFSERYGGIMAGTTRAGNSPHKAIEVIRNYSGVVPEEALPFSKEIDTWEKYYSGVTFALKMQGLSWLRKNEVKHEWVLDGQHGDWQERLKHGLKFSPLGIAVQAWTLENGLFVRRGSDTHWCTLVGYLEGKYWLVMDSYDKYLKKLAWDYSFTRAKRYSVAPRKELTAQFMIRAAQGLLGAYV